MERTNKRYGWIPDIPDHRDHYFALPVSASAALPSKVDLRPLLPPCYDQGSLGSCTSNAIAAAVQFDLRKQNLPDFMPSRLFIYYNERALEGTIASDAGAVIRDGIKSMKWKGACTEETWPYDISRFASKPRMKCYREALKHQAVKYARVPQDLQQMKTCLANGFPFVGGVAVYESFESDAATRTGDIPMPRRREHMLGGHAILFVGYDDERNAFIFRNSWSEKWGDQGYGTIPYNYLVNPYLADDFWVIQVMEGASQTAAPEKGNKDAE